MILIHLPIDRFLASLLSVRALITLIVEKDKCKKIRLSFANHYRKPK